MIKLLCGSLYSYERLRFTGLNVQHILNIASKNGIIIKNAIRLEYTVLEADVYRVHIKKLKGLLNEGAYKITSVKRRGIFYKLLSTKKRFFLYIGLLVALCLITVNSLFVRSLKITGYDDTENIMRIAHETGIFGFKNNVQHKLEAFKEAVEKSDGDIVWSSVSLNGTSVEIYIKEKAYTKNDEGTDGALKAKKDCVIQNLIVTGGTANVKNGTAVSEGQELILPWVKMGESIYPVKAEGKAIASVWYSLSASEALTENTFKETGNESYAYEINLFGAEIKSEAASPYADYSVIREKVKTYGLPIEINKVTYKERKQETVTKDRETVIKEAESALLSRLYMEIPKEAAINKALTQVEEGDGVLTVYVHIETVEDVIIRG